MGLKMPQIRASTSQQSTSYPYLLYCLEDLEMEEISDGYKLSLLLTFDRKPNKDKYTAEGQKELRLESR